MFNFNPIQMKSIILSIKQLSLRLEIYSERSLACFLALIMLTFSCTLYDNDSEQPLVTKSIDYKAAIDQLKANLDGIEERSERLSVFYDWQENQDLDYIDTTDWHQYENLTFLESVQFIYDAGYSEDLITAYENIETNLEIAQNVQVVLDIFKSEVSLLDLNEGEQARTDTFIKTIEYGIYAYASNHKSGGCSWIGCAAATYALIAAAIPLTAVALTGVGFALAFIGYIIAIAFWGESCGPCFGF